MNEPQKGNLYFLLLLVYQLILSFGAALFSVTFSDSIPRSFYTSPMFMLLSQLLSYAPAFLLFMLLTREKASRLVPMKSPDFRNICLVVMMCVLVQPFMMLLSAVSSLLFPNNISTVMTELGTHPFIFTLTAAALAPAICEEATFRGVLLSSYRNADIKKAAFVNGLFFGIVHMDLQQFLYAFILGIVFTYTVYYTGSVFYSMLGHFVINGCQTLLLYLPVLSEQEAVSEPAAAQGDLLYTITLLLVVCAIILPFLILLYKAFVRRNKPKLAGIKEYVAEPVRCFNWAFWCVVLYFTITSILTYVL